MRYFLFLILLVGLPALAAAQTDADQLANADQEQLQTCLTNNRGEDCIGIIARACDGEPDSHTTAGMISCAGREYAVWDEYLNGRYVAVLDWYAGDQDYNVRQRERIRAAQRIWITARDADCEVEAGRYDGGSLARVTRAYCLAATTARRALWLDSQMQEG